MVMITRFNNYINETNNSIYESKSYFDNYEHIPIIMNTNEEIDEVYNFIVKNINSFLKRPIDTIYLEGLKKYLLENEIPNIVYYKDENSFRFGPISYTENNKEFTFNKFYTVSDLPKVKQLILNNGIIEPSYKPRKIIKESNYFDSYNNIVIAMNTEEEINYVYNYIVDNINKYLDYKVYYAYLEGLLYKLRMGDIPTISYYSDQNKFKYGTVKFTEQEKGVYFIYDKIHNIKDLPEIKQLIINNGKRPSYNPKKIIRENILLEKSSLTPLGVPREVMQPIQKDFALSSDVEWEKMDYKKDIIQLLRQGDKELFIQITNDSIVIFGCYPSPKGTVYFVDKYIYRDTDWSGEYEKIKREYKTITQTVIDIEPKTNIYKLKGDFSIDTQNKRKMINKEKSFVEFTENFKTDFLKKFDSILKRITGTHYKKAKKEIEAKAKKIALENQLLIQGLDNPLRGPNGLTILDEFLHQFEEAYSEYFEERIDLEEMGKYFTNEKVMTMFMYYIYRNRLMN